MKEEHHHHLHSSYQAFAVLAVYPHMLLVVVDAGIGVGQW